MTSYGSKEQTGFGRPQALGPDYLLPRMGGGLKVVFATDPRCEEHKLRICTLFQFHVHAGVRFGNIVSSGLLTKESSPCIAGSVAAFIR